MPRIISDYKGQAKDIIIRAALSAFSKRGYRNTTMANLAKDVGVTKADLYHYFPSKAALLREIATSFQSTFAQTIVEGFQKAKSWEDLTQVAMQLLDEQVPTEELWFDLIVASFNDPEIANFLKTKNQEYRESVANALARLTKSSNEFRVRSVSDDVVMSVMLLLYGAIFSRRMGTNRKVLQRAMMEGLRSSFSIS